LARDLATRSITILVTTLTVGVTALMLTEGFLRISNIWVGRHSDTMFRIIEYDSLLGWKMKPNINEKIDLVDVEDIPVRSNREGFWDKEFSLEKSSGRCRIAFLGDSFTWGMGVSEEERFSNLVSSADPRWESLNFGVPAYGIDQSLLLWQSIAHRYQPNLVALTVYQNDYLDNSSLVRYGRRKPYFELSKEQKLEAKGIPVDKTDFWKEGIFNQIAPPYTSWFNEPVEHRSRIVHWFAKNSDAARAAYTFFRIRRTQKTEEIHNEEGKGGLGPLEKYQVELLRLLVEQLEREAENAGTRLIVVLAGEPNPRFELQKEKFDQAGLTYVDATTENLRNLSAGEFPIYQRFSRHWTSEAHRAVANLLIQEIQKRGFCKSNP